MNLTPGSANPNARQRGACQRAEHRAGPRGEIRPRDLHRRAEHHRVMENVMERMVISFFHQTRPEITKNETRATGDDERGLF
jgi:hypothetical protein